MRKRWDALAVLGLAAAAGMIDLLILRGAAGSFGGALLHPLAHALYVAATVGIGAATGLAVVKLLSTGELHSDWRGSTSQVLRIARVLPPCFALAAVLLWLLPALSIDSRSGTLGSYFAEYIGRSLPVLLALLAGSFLTAIQWVPTCLALGIGVPAWFRVPLAAAIVAVALIVLGALAQQIMPAQTGYAEPLILEWPFFATLAAIWLALATTRLLGPRWIAAVAGLAVLAMWLVRDIGSSSLDAAVPDGLAHLWATFLPANPHMAQAQIVYLDTTQPYDPIVLLTGNIGLTLLLQALIIIVLWLAYRFPLAPRIAGP